MTRTLWIIAALFWCLGAIPASAQVAPEKILPVDGHITQDGQAVELNWFDATPPRVGSVTVKRRLYGQTGGHTWKAIGEDLGPVMRYRDDTIRPGMAYEYQVLRTARDIVDVGYWLAGTQIPAQARRGRAYIIVDETVAKALAPRLERFGRDLVGDGWQVTRHDVPRQNNADVIANLKNAIALKAWLQERFTQDPFGQHTIILVGHVPVVLSGKVAPDGHESRPHPTDLFYADMDGRWSARQNGEILDGRLPSDFIEMQIGRIDLAPVSDGNKGAEIRLLRAYFDKNHHWRMGYLGDLRDAYGKTEHLAVERAALRNIVGATNLAQGSHHDVGEKKPWLWGVDFGDWNGARYAKDYANKAVFAINFGSNKQMINARFNGMTALLAQPWYPVAVGWGGRPAWWLHHMALGGSIGDVHMRTVNNGRAPEPYRESMDYFPPGTYVMRNGIWVNLLGDPTLRAFPLAPPQKVTVTSMPDGAKLSWLPAPDPDAQGYQVFRAGPGEARFSRLGGAEPITQTRFTDPKPVQGGRYMVRAYGLKTVYAGSFHTLSQGVFASETSVSETHMTLSAVAGHSTPLPDVFNGAASGTIHAIVAPPARGELVRNETGWSYTPPAGFTGEIDLPFSVFDGMQSRAGQLQINVTR